jgi:hypothetical protein
MIGAKSILRVPAAAAEAARIGDRAVALPATDHFAQGPRGRILRMAVSSRAKALTELTHRTRKALDEFRDELKRTRRWSPEHQAAYNAWKRHLDDSEKHAREASGKTPKAAWDLAVAQARRERDFWSSAKSRASAHRSKKIGVDVFDADEE